MEDMCAVPRGSHGPYAAAVAVQIVRAGERLHTELDWLDSWHSFSFGPHYDPANTHHGLLIVNNDDVVRAGGGFGTHAHRDMEIVTWVLSGELAHRDSTGTDGVIYPGLAQRMSAGTGILHSEMNASATADVHFVQMWVPPDTQDLEPSYEQRDLAGALDRGGLVTVASGRHEEGAITIHQRDAVLYAVRVVPDEPVEIPAASHVHVFVAVGDAVLDERTLAAGDAVRLTAEPPVSLQGGTEGGEVLVWATA
jgi:redox-sensitive bicupin YhaK (pirin superfamily)